MSINSKKIIGRLEHVSFPNFGIENIEAKIDTGAYSGSIHVSSIRETKHNGVDAVSFMLVDEFHPQYQNIEHIVVDFKKKSVKSSNGLVEDRYFIKTPFVLGDEVCVGLFSLSDRSNMKYPVLLGRKLFKKDFLVDASRTFLLSLKNN